MSIDMTLTRGTFAGLDQSDPLAGFRDEFLIEDGAIYLDGNSLGPCPAGAMARAKRLIEKEWAVGLIRSWNTAGWFDLSIRLGDKIASLIGADQGEAVVTDSTSLNLFKLVSVALAMRPDRKVILMEGSNFPTDNYMVQGLIEFIDRGHEIRFCEKDELLDGLKDDVAVVCLTQVHYKTGHLLDMGKLTEKAHEVGALTIWDLCHSAGALPVDLNGAQADFAVGCTYKYLNGGPGSPAFLFVAKRHQNKVRQPLTGWLGHESPFRFDRDYVPATGIRQFLTSTQPVLSLAMTEVGLDIFLRADIRQIREKSEALTGLFIRLMQEKCGRFGFTLASPEDPNERGSQVSFRHDHGYPIMKALIERGVIGDFRAPDIVRFGFTPLYTRHLDVWDAVETLEDIMERGEWKKPEYQKLDAVT